MEKRFLSLLLVAVMLFTMCPIAAIAADEHDHGYAETVPPEEITTPVTTPPEYEEPVPPEHEEPVPPEYEEPALPEEQNIPTIELDIEYEAAIDNGGDSAFFAFTPDVSHLYIFRSFAGEGSDTYGALYDSNWTRLDSNDDYEGLNFAIFAHLEAGRTYYFEARHLNDHRTGSFPVSITMDHVYKVNTLAEATCSEAGTKEYVCYYCDDSYTEEYYVEHEYNSDGICTVCGEACPEIEPDAENVVNTERGETLFYTFTPEMTHTYRLIVEGYNDEYVYLTFRVVDERGEDLLWSDANACDVHFEFYEGITYTIEITCNDCYKDSADIYIELSTLHVYGIDIVTAGTCIEAGVKEYTCGACGYSYTEEYYAEHRYGSDGICTVCGEESPYPVLVPDTEYEFDLINDGAEVYIFTPESYDYYTFSASSESVYSSIIIGTLDGETISSRNGYDYRFDLRLDPELTYVVEIYHYWHDSYDTVRVSVNQNHAYKVSVTEEATCIDAGIKEYVCEYCGDSYTEEYYGNHEYENFECVVCGEELPRVGLELGAETVVTIKDGETLCYTFTAETSHVYSFSIEPTNYYSYPTLSVTVFDEHGIMIASNDGSSDFYSDFLIIEGKTYTVTIECLDSGYGYTDLSVHVDTHHSYYSRVTQRATCSEEGTREYICAYCDDMYYETYIEDHFYDANGNCTACDNESPYPILTPDTEINVDVSNGESVTYLFVPETTHPYELFVSSEYTWIGIEIFNENGDYIDWFDGYDFYADLFFEEGHNYYIHIYPQDYYESATVNITITGRHEYHNRIIKEGTCVDAGVIEYTCHYCHYSYTKEYYSEHAYGSDILEEATCSVAGIVEYTCINCGDSYTEEYYAEHAYGSDGICTVCGEESPYPIFMLENEYELNFINTYEHIYMFTPDATDYYYFNVYSDYVYSGIMIEASDRDFIGENNGYYYDLEVYLEAGQTYLIYIYHQWSDSYRGTVNITLTQSHDYYSRILEEGTCVDAGVIEYACYYCDDTFTEEYYDNHDYKGTECTVCGHQIPSTVIELDTEYEANIVTGGESAYFVFTPEVSHTYIFRSFADTSHYDTYGILYDSNWNRITANDDYMSLNFGVIAYLEAGQTYYFVAKHLGNYAVGNFPVSIAIQHEYDSKFIEKGTCESIGMVEYTCYYCDDSYTEQHYGDHDFIDEIYDEATCAVDGIMKHTCSYCGFTYTSLYYVTHHFNDNGVCTDCGYKSPYPILNVGTEYELDIINDGIIRFTFCPDSTDNYLFHIASSSVVSSFTMYNEDGQIIYTFEDYVLNLQTLVEGGTMYVIEVKCEYYDEYDTVAFSVSQSHNYVLTIITEATCTEAGLRQLTCYHCGDTYTEEYYENHVYINGFCTVCGSHPFGKCGDDLTWEIIDGVLTISGEGDMWDYTDDGTPWYSISNTIEQIIIEDGVTFISTGAFVECTLVESVIIPDSVVEIGYAAFAQCISLKSVTFGSGLLHIGDLAFAYCISLESIIIPDSVVEIGYAAFGECDSLTTVHIGSGVTYIGEYAFADCYLKDIYYNGTEEEWNLIDIASNNREIFEAELHFEDEVSVIYADINGDAEITARDAAMTYAIVNGKLDADEEQLLAADVNGDGEVTARDAAMIYAYVNGKLASFPVEG